MSPKGLGGCESEVVETVFGGGAKLGAAKAFDLGETLMRWLASSTAAKAGKPP